MLDKKIINDIMNRMARCQDILYDLYTTKELPQQKIDKLILDFSKFLDNFIVISSMKYHWDEVNKIQKAKIRIKKELESESP